MSMAADLREQLASLSERVARLEGVRRQLGVEPVVARVVEAAADASGLTVADILSPRTDRRTVVARYAAIWVARHIAAYSLPRLGRAFGGRDHTTIMHALRRAERWRGDDQAFVMLCDTIEAAVRATLHIPIGASHAAAFHSA